MSSVCFVVLHYQNIEYTKKCVESLQKLNSPSEIVIVDNASPNGSGELLIQYYGFEKSIYIVKSEKNLGFAGGNNLGYQWAKHNLNGIDTILCINNDVVIEDKDFIKKIRTYIDRTSCDVLGVDIYNPITGVHQNPLRAKALEYKDIRTLYGKLYKHFCITWVKRILSVVMETRKKTESVAPMDRNEQWKMECFEPVLHGACVIFCSRYIAKEDNAFHPGTFLYYEEDILAIRCKKKKYHVCYNPDVSILHFEGKSTATGVDEFNRNIFKIKESYKSLSILKQYMEEM